jgi:hypothetical protein
VTLGRARAAFLVGLLAVGATPLLARALAPGEPGACAYDGLQVEAGAPVVVEGAGEVHRFCCVSCAQRFLEGAGDASVLRVWVTDAATGKPVAAGAATFVRGGVLANAATGDRVLAFSSREDAERHAEAHGGVVLDGDERPLRTSPGVAPAP